MDTFWAAIVGAVVGGIFTLFGGWFSHLWQQGALKEKEKKTLRNALCAVKLEFEEFWESYKRSLNIIEEQYPDEKNEVFQFIRQKPFPIYQNSISLLSQLLDEELQQLMLKAHMAFCALMDKMEAKNMVLVKRENFACMSINSNNPVYTGQVQVLNKELEKQTAMLEASRKEIEELMKVLLPKMGGTIQSLQ